MNSDMRTMGARPFVEQHVGRHTNQRLVWLDALRVLSAFAVVWLHVSAQVVATHPDSSSLGWWIGNIADSCVRWSVPVFVMISGGLIIPRAGGQSISAFYRQRIVRLCIPLLFWSAVFEFYSGMQGGFSAKGMLVRFLLGVPYYHIWFIFMLVGLYLVAPFISEVSAFVSKRSLWLMVLGGYLLLSLHEGLSAVRGSPGQDDVFNQWVVYVPYFVAGHLMMSAPAFGKRVNWIFLLLFSVTVISVATGVLLPLLGAPRTMGLMYGYLNPFVAASAFSVFQLFHSLDINARIANILSKASVITIGVYFVHPLWIAVANSCGLSPEAPMLGTPLLSIVVVSTLVFLLSLLTCVLIRPLPMGQRLVT